MFFTIRDHIYFKKYYNNFTNLILLMSLFFQIDGNYDAVILLAIIIIILFNKISILFFFKSEKSPDIFLTLLRISIIPVAICTSILALIYGELVKTQSQLIDLPNYYMDITYLMRGHQLIAI